MSRAAERCLTGIVAPAAIRRPARLPAVPTLMLAGGRDLSTPLGYAPDAGPCGDRARGEGRAAVRTFLLR